MLLFWTEVIIVWIPSLSCMRSQTCEGLGGSSVLSRLQAAWRRPPLLRASARPSVWQAGARQRRPGRPASWPRPPAQPPSCPAWASLAAATPALTWRAG